VIYLILKSFATKRFDMFNFLRISIIGIMLISISSYILQLDISLLLDRLSAGFDFDNPTNESAYRRNEQFHALIDGWLENPLIGAGHGAAAIDNKNLEEMQWAYELSYLALLFQVGIIGFLVYLISIIWMIIKLIQKLKKNQEYSIIILPILVGLICFLIANATNPYLLKFDYLWVIFLPLAYLNAICINNSHFNNRKK